jgi:hypothetical protein
MPRLPKFMRGGKIDYFGKRRMERDVGLFIEDLNFWLDSVFLYQRIRTKREAERFIRQLKERVGQELDYIIDDQDNEKLRKKVS